MTNLAATSILSSLRERVGDIEFGYRAQGLLAHTLMRMGAQILEVHAQGHPDILARFRRQKMRLEVEVAHAKLRTHTIKVDDLEAISPCDEAETGYLAILDCAVPLFWALVDYQRLRWQKPRSVSLVFLRAIADKELSNECTKNFIELVVQHESNITNLTFPLLCSRVQKGEGL